MPRRYAMYPPEFQVFNVLSTAGATILGVGYLLPMVYLTCAWFYGKPAGNNPWGAKGLEWETTSPPPTFNFDRTPIVTEATHSVRPPGGGQGCLKRRSTDAGAHAHASRGCSITSTRWRSRRRRPPSGMWVFLVTEIMFFGGMFAAYMIYRMWYFPGFAAASEELDIMLGGINTAVLIGIVADRGAGRARGAGRQAEADR